MFSIVITYCKKNKLLLNSYCYYGWDYYVLFVLLQLFSVYLCSLTPIFFIQTPPSSVCCLILFLSSGLSRLPREIYHQGHFLLLILIHRPICSSVTSRKTPRFFCTLLPAAVLCTVWQHMWCGSITCKQTRIFCLLLILDKWKSSRYWWISTIVIVT